MPLNVYAAKFAMAAKTLGVREGGHELKVCVEGQLIFNTTAQSAMCQNRWKGRTTPAIKLGVPAPYRVCPLTSRMRILRLHHPRVGLGSKTGFTNI
jgi:hypothetical protein